jgi:2-keto-4-pentenoate hydratase
MSAHEDAAAQLYHAEQARKQMRLLSKAHPTWTMDDAYAVQALLVKRKIVDGRRIIGWKIGLTSKAMQDALKINIPDSGVLLDDMLFASGATIPNGRFIQPHRSGNRFCHEIGLIRARLHEQRGHGCDRSRCRQPRNSGYAHFAR